MNSSLNRLLVNKGIASMRIVWTLRAIAAMAFLIFSSSQLMAATATATWDANTESDIAGYILSYGTQSGTYTTSVDVGNVTTTQVTVAGGLRYFFVVKAYNTSAQVSPNSAEVFADIPGTAAPVISGLSPTSGAVGTSVTITGSGFGTPQGASTVRFNGTTTTSTSWSATSIVAPVPTGATTGAVVVTVNGVASNGMTFTLASPAPSVVSLSPTSGVIGTSVTIAGANFGATQGTSLVRFNGTTATPTSWNATSIVAPAPTGASTGPVVVTVNGVASNGITFTVGTSSLPAPWISQDVGAPAVAGQATFASGAFSVSGGGADIWNNSDQFRFVYQTLSGDGTIVARVDSVQNSDPWTKAAVMIREDLAGNSPNAVALLSAGNGMTFQWRATRGGTSSFNGGFAGVAPRWIRLVRAGNTLTGYSSVNGTAWTLMGTSTVTMAAQVYVGLAVTSHNAAVAATAAFSNVTVTSGANQAPTLTQPVSQNSAEGTTASLQLVASDPNGNPLTYSATGLPASLSVNPTSGLISGVLTFTSAGTYSVTATASDGSLSNAKTFTWTVTNTNQPPALTQPVSQTSAEGTTVSLQLVASDPDGGALSYVVTGLPASLSVNAATGLISGTLTFTSSGTYSVTATASDGALSNGKTFTWTVTDVGQGPNITGLSPSSGPVGMSVTINGSNFGTTQGTSTIRFNGTMATPTSWSATSIVAPVPTGATTGMDVVTVNGVASNGMTFTVSASGTLPAPWATQDIGSPALAGQATFASGTFSVTGAGADIWYTPDQFRFVYQTLVGDGEIVARVGSLQNTDTWAKAGVMIREDLASNAPDVMAVVTPGSGTVFQKRLVRGQNTNTTTAGIAGAAPQWVRLVRSGNTFSGYVSTNGTTWTLMGSGTVTMASQVFVGLALTSHNASVTANATFTNVTVNGVTTNATPAFDVISSSATPGAAPLASSNQATAKKAIVKALPVSHPTLNDYDGDGRADIATYRPSTGEWRIRTSRSNYATDLVRRWGTATDVPVPGDYDGDRRTDLAFYRPSTGTWSILKSSGNYTTSFDVWLGADGDVPVPGDYDGDGVSDVAVYSPATGQWRILKSTTGYATEIVSLWGAATDIPVPGDYDGDGKADLAVYRPSTGEWRIRLSSTDYTTNVTMVLGSSTDTPVAADYDGDGITDVAVFEAATGKWQVRLSSTHFKTTVVATLGARTDIPVPGDYDGDGSADIAVFHSGTWQILFSGAGEESRGSVSSGRGTDVPLAGRP